MNSLAKKLTAYQLLSFVILGLLFGFFISRIVDLPQRLLAIILVGVALFNVHIIGNPLALLGIVLLGSLMFVALGYMISGLARSQDSVIAITNMINFPMMFLSGIFFPIALMPNWIRPVVDAMPLTYLADLLRQVMIKSVPTFSMSIDIGVLA